MATQREATITLDPELAELRAVAVSPTGRFALTYGRTKSGYRITTWDVQQHKELRRVDLGGSVPRMVRFTGDELAIVGGLLSGEDGHAKICRWSIDGDGDVDDFVYEHGDVAGLAISRDASVVAFRHQKAGGLTILYTATGVTARVGQESLVERVVVSPLGTLIIAAVEGSVNAYRLDGSQIGRWSYPARTLGCSEDVIVAARQDQLDVLSGAAPGPIYVTPSIRRIAVASAGDLVAVSADWGLSVFDLVNRENVTPLPVKSPARRLTFSLDDRVLGSAHEDNLARIWDLSALLPQTTTRVPRSADKMRAEARTAEEAGASLTAIELYSLLAEGGDIAAFRDLGRLFSQAGRDGEALTAYRRSLEAGDNSALRDLGRAKRNSAISTRRLKATSKP